MGSESFGLVTNFSYLRFFIVKGIFWKCKQKLKINVTTHMNLTWAVMGRQQIGSGVNRTWVFLKSQLWSSYFSVLSRHPCVEYAPFLSASLFCLKTPTSSDGSAPSVPPCLKLSLKVSFPSRASTQLLILSQLHNLVHRDPTAPISMSPLGLKCLLLLVFP